MLRSDIAALAELLVDLQRRRSGAQIMICVHARSSQEQPADNIQLRAFRWGHISNHSMWAWHMPIDVDNFPEDSRSYLWCFLGN